MGFLDKLKKVFAKPESEPIPEDESEALLRRLAGAATIEPYLDQLRMRWIRDEQPNKVLAKKVLAAASERFPQQDALLRILRVLHGGAELETSDAPLLAYATSLTQTPNLALEGHLYRTKSLLKTSGRRAISSVIRAVGTGRAELEPLRWYASGFLKDCAISLYQKADKQLGADDAAAALVLAFITVEASSGLLSPDWRKSISRTWPGCGPRVSQEAELLSSFSAHFVNLAQERSMRGSLNPAFVIRCRKLGRTPGKGVFIEEIQNAVVRGRTSETTDVNFLSMETTAHRGRMAKLMSRFEAIQKAYDGCLGLIELRAEEAAIARDTGGAVEKFRELLRRKPDQSYYAYRAAQILTDAGQRDEARPFWVHAARTPGSGWRSKLASLASVSVSYDFEAAKLCDAHDTEVSRAAGALAGFLEMRMNDAWDSSSWTVAYALGGKAAELYHLASAVELDRGKQETFRDKAVELYTQVDASEALKEFQDGRLPEGVYESIVVPLTATPV